MLEGIQFALLGLGAGAAYGLTALGLVVIHRGSNVVNFAHGAFAAIAAYVYWWLAVRNGWGWLAAALVAVAAAAVAGVLVSLGVMRPMRLSSPLTRTIATLGVLIVVQAVLGLITPPEVLSVPSFLPAGGLHMGAISLGYDRLVISLVSIVICAALVRVSRGTRFGLATTAAAENRRSAAALGVSPDRIATVNWAVGSGLAGLAAVLLTPILGLQITTMTALTFPCLAAAVVGRVSSFGLTLVAGFGLGVAESLTTQYVATPGWAAAIPFVVILVMMTLRNRSIPTRGDVRERLPAIGSGRIQPLVVVVAAATGLYLIWGPFQLSFIDAIVVTLGVGTIVLSQVLVTGYAGLLSLCQVTMAGLGALVAGRFMVVWGWPFELAAVVAMVVAFLVGLLLGLPALRTRGISLAVLTMGFAVAVQSLLFGGTLAGVGLTGDNVGVRTLFGLNVDSIENPRRYATSALIVFVVALLAVANIRRSQSGRRMIAVRESERAARSLGINVYSTKLYAFAAAGALAASGGIVLAFRNPFLTYGSGYEYTQSLGLLANAVVGGLGSIAGALVGTAAIQPGGVAQQLLAPVFAGNERLFVLIGGLGLIYVLWDAADGVVITLQARFRRLVHKRRGREPVAATATGGRAATLVAAGSAIGVTLPPAAGSPAGEQRRPGANRSAASLTVEDVTVRYGGVTAVDAASFTVGPGEVFGIIGPNGAGKTSLIDAITGFTPVSSGSIHLGDRCLDGLPAHHRARLGLARSFQSLELFDDFTVRENLLTACDQWRYGRFVTDPVVPSRGTLSAAAEEAVEQFGLADLLDTRIRELPYGLRRLCAVARSVAAEPSVLLLDEPAAGLGDDESDELASHIRRLADDHGLAIVLIEHNLELVVDVSDTMMALDFGRVISTGDPREIREDPRVVLAYLGAEPDVPRAPSSATEVRP